MMEPTETRVWIAQILCPRRHCILAAAFDDATVSVPQAEAGLVTEVVRLVAIGAIGETCNICGSSAWRCESGRTPFRSMEEARLAIEQLQRENEAARRFFAAAKGGKI